MKKTTLFLYIFIFTLLTPATLLAASVPGSGGGGGAGLLGTDLKDQYAFGFIDSLSQGIGLLITPAFTIASIALVFYFLVGGFKYLTSAGDKSEVDKANKMITHSIIGFILLMLLFLIVKFIPEFFGLGIQIIL